MFYIRGDFQLHCDICGKVIDMGKDTHTTILISVIQENPYIRTNKAEHYCIDCTTKRLQSI